MTHVIKPNDFKPKTLGLKFLSQVTNVIKPSDFKPNGIKPSDHLSILLSEVEQEQRPSGNGDREAIVVVAGLCDGEGERAYIASAPHYILAFRTNIRSLRG